MPHQTIGTQAGYYSIGTSWLLCVLLWSAALCPSAAAQWSEEADCPPTASLGESSAVCDGTGCDNFGCDALGRRPLTFHSWLEGDQSDFRSGFEERGIRFTNNLTNFYMGNTRGGLEREFRFAGHGDYLAHIDIHKLGGAQGQFLQIRAEHRYGESISESTGAFLPAALATDLPTLESEQLFISNFLFTQALSESFAVFAGKLDTLDGDMNAFAHGRGIRQFSNAAFVVNPIGLRTIAYSTLGTGFVFLSEEEPIYTFLVLNAEDTVETDGFSELFAEGVVLSQEVRLPTNFFGKLGHQLFSAVWSSRDYASLQQSPLVILPNVPIARQSGSWALTYNFDQYLFVDPHDSERGWGLFGRAGLADPDTNPIEYFLSLGVGGNSRLRGRGEDTFGIGWYYSGTSERIAPFLSAALGNLQDSQGGEVFYNIAVNKRTFVTLDAQVIEPARSNVDTALLCGLRLNMLF